MGEDSEIGQIEFEARFGVERDDVALGNAERGEAGGNFLGRAEVLIPRVGQIAAAGSRLAQCRGVSVLTRDLFQNLIEGPLRHSMQCNMEVFLDGSAGGVRIAPEFWAAPER